MSDSRRCRPSAAVPNEDRAWSNSPWSPMPLFVILLAIIQFGLIFNCGRDDGTNVTREGEATGPSTFTTSACSKAQNAPHERLHQDLAPGLDEHTGEDVPALRDRVTGPRAARRSTNGDLVAATCSRAERPIPMRGWASRSPCAPPTTRTWSSRSSQFLPKDMNGRLGLVVEVTMVVELMARSDLGRARRGAGRGQILVLFACSAWWGSWPPPGWRSTSGVSQR